jgi:DNA polymerase I-like protein with 3'-5' exonuclease and polymerase domains
MIIAIDLETINGDGKSDFRWWKPGFKIQSIALSWRDQGEIVSWFSCESAEIDAVIKRLHEKQHPLIVQNLSFEMGVLNTLYPQYPLNWHADTMRLAQLWDNGGDWRDQKFNGDELDEENSPELGISLEAIASRILQKDFHKHKEQRDSYLRSVGVRSNFGGHIHLLPPDILREYNIADTVVTLEIFDALTPKLSAIWEKDWELYKTRVFHMNSAYRRGIVVDSNKLWGVIQIIDAEIDNIDADFREKYYIPLEKWAKTFNKDPKSFNISSTKQLSQLFIQVMGLTAQHTTKKGEELIKKKEITFGEACIKYPSLATKHLEDYGEAGKHLKLRKKRLLVLSQALSAYEMAKQGNGRAHPEIKASGTRTNRVSGGTYE